jgi:RimJ/RimL family protein N-acetyltransferase
MSPVTVRCATVQDAERLLRWRNDAETRAASRTTVAITPGEHKAWLARTLADNRCHLLIGERAGTPVGQVRFDAHDDDRYEIGVGLEPEARGRGLGAPLIAAGVQWLRARTSATIVAEVRDDNMPSLKAFTRAGFRPVIAAAGWCRLEYAGGEDRPAESR